MASNNIMSRNRDDYYMRVIFPEETWVNIIDKVSSSDEDVESCTNGVTLFRRILASKRVEFLFPKVFNILLTKGYLVQKLDIDNNVFASSQYSDEEGDYWEIERPPTSESGVDAGARKILKLRLVCKSWKNTVDNLYKKTLFHGTSGMLPYGKAFEQKFCPPLYICRNAATTISLFLGHFNKYYENTDNNFECGPFLSKGCIFLFGESCKCQSPQQFMKDVSSLLKEYGGHLEKCTFDFLLDTDCRMYQAKLPEWLGLMPNLKKLEIIGWRYPVSMHPVPLSRLENHFLYSHLPRMEKLENLVLDRVKYPVGSHILRANNHVTRLDLANSLNHGSYFNELPKLTHLKIDIYSEMEFDRFKTAEFNPAFKTLYMVLHFVNYEPWALFKALGETCGHTLTGISLVIKITPEEVRLEHNANIENDCEHFRRIFLPRVTSFHVVIKESVRYQLACIRPETFYRC